MAVKSLVLADVLDAGFGALVCDVDIVPIQEPFKALADAGALSPDGKLILFHFLKKKDFVFVCFFLFCFFKKNRSIF